MFSTLGANLTKVFDKLRGKGFISEDDINSAMREIRISLLEADVSLEVIKEFISTIKEKALGAELLKSVTPGQLIVKIVNDELVNLLKSDSQELNLNATPPAVIMMVGLQGSGKTTSSAKLANFIKSKSKKKVLMASLDTYRPAAQKQLAVLGEQTETATVEIIEKEDPIAITKRALKEASLKGFDVLILDTAGRLHTDEDLIAELNEIKKLSKPVETLLVADSLTGQDAVNIGRQFNEKVGITGIILTRVDGDARGGAALSMRHVTNCPIKFIGVGEKTSEFEPFYADRIASRILDMGDVVSLVEKAKEAIDEKEAAKMATKLKHGVFDLNDMLDQFKSLKKMGGMGKLVNLIPGMGKIKEQISGAGFNENIISRQEAIILSMTQRERRNPLIINASRKKRIALGSGTKVEDVNKLLKQHLTMTKMLKKFGGMNEADLKKMERMISAKQF